MAQVSGELGRHVLVKGGTAGELAIVADAHLIVGAQALDLSGMWNVNNILPARFWSIAVREGSNGFSSI
jgi:hypothetical protein